MVETRFDRGVYEDEEDESNGGGEGGSSSSSSSGGGGSGDSLNLTENEKNADIVIRDGNIVAADEDAKVESSTPTQIIGGGGSSNSSSSGGGSSSGPETTAVKKSITVEDQRTKVENPEGETVSRADLITEEAKAEERRINLENRRDFEISRGNNNAAQELEQNIQQARKREDTLESNVDKIAAIEQQQNQTKTQEREVDGFQRITNEAKDIPQTLRQNRGGFTDNLKQIGRETQDLGRALQEEGGQLGQNVEEEVSTTLGGGSAAARGVEQPQGLAERTGQLTGGISTLGTQAGGFFIEGGGGIIELRADDLDDLSEFEGSRQQTQGIGEFGEEVEEQVEEDPVGFVLEEGGEEIGEAAVGGLLLGPAGVALGATPTVEPEVEPEIEQEIQTEPEVEQQVSTLENEVEPENIPETEQVPTGIIETQTPQLEQQRSRTPETFETGGIRRTEMDAGPEVISRQPSSTEFESSPEQAQSREFVEQDTGFLPEEQEVIRNRRGREDITLRQEENLIRDFGPGETRPEEGATVLEAEQTETGGELLFSFMGPVPVTPDIEPEQELNPQPPQADVTGPTSDNLNPNIDLEPEQEFGLTQDTQPETNTRTDLLIESETEVNSVFTEVEPRQEQSQPPIEDQPQDNPLQQEPENLFEEPTQQTSAEPTVETGLEQFVERNTTSELEPRRPNPRGPLGGLPPFQIDNTEEPQNIFSTEQPERGPERTPSLDAVVLGITSEDTGGDDEFFTGFETRPIATRENEEDLDLFT